MLGSAESENTEYKNDSRAANLRHQTIGHPQVSKHPENINWGKMNYFTTNLPPSISLVKSRRMLTTEQVEDGGECIHSYLKLEFTSLFK